MFSRYTERARQVLVYAREEARGLKRDRVGTEHILLGLLREEQGLGTRVLLSLGITGDRVEDCLRAVADLDSGPTGRFPFTACAARVLEQASLEADALSKDTTSTHHLLLGLLQEPDAEGVRVLVELGVSPVEVRKRVLASIHTAPNEWPMSMQESRDSPTAGLNATGGVSNPSEVLRAHNVSAMRAAERAYADATTDRQRRIASDEIDMIRTLAELL